MLSLGRTTKEDDEQMSQAPYIWDPRQWRAMTLGIAQGMRSAARVKVVLFLGLGIVVTRGAS